MRKLPLVHSFGHEVHSGTGIRHSHDSFSVGVDLDELPRMGSIQSYRFRIVVFGNRVLRDSVLGAGAVMLHLGDIKLSRGGEGPPTMDVSRQSHSEEKPPSPLLWLFVILNLTVAFLE